MYGDDKGEFLRNRLKDLVGGTDESKEEFVVALEEYFDFLLDKHTDKYYHNHRSQY